MSVVGLITEYNPFHKGHEYHIKKAKELTGAEHAIVVMVCGIVVLVGEFAFYVVVAVCLDHLVSLIAENDLSAVERQILVIRTSVRDIVLVAEFLSLRAYITHDITYFLACFAIVILDTTEIANTLLAAPLWAQCTVTSRAISVEVTL
jgi:hypothetical protein